MGWLLALLVIVLVALLVVQTGTNALMLTGMPRTVALFQAASAFFGVGFTTTEAEMVVSHPVRRRIVLVLIVCGNIGLTSVLATLIVTFVSVDGQEGMERLRMVGSLVLGILVMVIIMYLPFVRKPIDYLMRKALEGAGMVRVDDYEMLLKVRHGYCVSEFELPGDHPVVGKSLLDLRLYDYGMVVLGIDPEDGPFVGAPSRDCVLQAGDIITVYGGEDAVERLVKGEMQKVER